MIGNGSVPDWLPLRDEQTLVQFEGSWTAAEKTIITQALAAIEAHDHLPPCTQQPAWVCSRVDQSEPVYTAVRAHTDEPLTARSVFELRLRLLDMAGLIATF